MNNYELLMKTEQRTVEIREEMGEEAFKEIQADFDVYVRNKITGDRR